MNRGGELSLHALRPRLAQLTSEPPRPIRLLLGLLRRPAARTPLYALLFTLTFFIGRQTVPQGATVALVWPASGVAFLWAYPHVRNRRWGSVDSATSLVSLGLLALLLNLLVGNSLVMSVFFGIANFVQGVVSAWVYCARARESEFGFATRRRLFDLFLGGFLGAVLSAPFAPGAAMLVNGSPLSGVWHYVLRGTLSVLVVGMVGLKLQCRLPGRLPMPHLPARIAAVVALTSASYTIVLNYPDEMLVFFLVPVSMVTALLFDVRFTAIHALAVSIITVWAASQGVGLLTGLGVVQRTVLVQLMVLVLVLVEMTLVMYRHEMGQLVRRVEGSQIASQAQAYLLERMISSLSEGVVLVGAEGSPILTNRAADELVGQRDAGGKRQLLELPVELFDPSYETSTPISRTLAGEPVARVDVTLEIDGTERILAVEASPLGSEEGSQALVILRDVTAERHHTQQLSSFAGVIAHDLLNPLSSMGAWSELLEDELRDDGNGVGLDSLSRITAAQERMRVLIQDLLAYSVTRSGELQPSPVDLETLVGEVLTPYADTHPDLEVTLDAAKTVEVDRGAIRQVLDNLISNACKYVAPGAPRRIDIRATDGCDGWIVVAVADRGVGIPAEEATKVFDEFHRVASHATDFRGTGLGLAIVRRLIERHGGHVVAKARPGGGSVFEFSLPPVGLFGTGRTTACQDACPLVGQILDTDTCVGAVVPLDLSAPAAEEARAVVA